MNHHNLAFLFTFIFLLATPSHGDQLDTTSLNNRILGQIISTFLVSEGESFTISDPTILALQDGGFFVAWHAGTATGDPDPRAIEYHLYGRIYNPDVPRTAKFRISTQGYYTFPGRPMLGQFDGNNIFVYWWGDIAGRTPDEDGDKDLFRSIIRGNGVIHEAASSVYQGPSVYSQFMTVLADGKVALGLNNKVLVSDTTRSSFSSLNGLKWGNTAQSAVALPLGGFVTFFASAGTIYGQTYSALGSIGTPFTVSSPIDGTANTLPYAAMLSNGNIVVAWTTQTAGPTTRTANARIISKEGNNLGLAEFKIGSIKLNSQLYVLTYPTGEFFLGWDEKSITSLTLYGNLYKADYTVKYDQLTVFTQIGIYSSPLAISLLKNEQTVAAAYDYVSKNVQALRFTPTQSTEEGTAVESSSKNTGLIIGVTIPSVIAGLILGYIGIRALRRRRLIRKAKIAALQEKSNSDQEKLTSPEPHQQATMNNNMAPPIHIIIPNQPMEPNQAQMLNSRQIDMYPDNPLKPAHQIDFEEGMASSQQNDINFAPGLEEPEAQQHIIDGRLAKPFMKGSHQPPVDRNPGNHSLVDINRQQINLDEHHHEPPKDDIQFGPQLDPSTMTSYVMDGRFAKAELLSVSQQQQQNNYFEASKRDDYVHINEEREFLTKRQEYKKINSNNGKEGHEEEEEKNDVELKDKMCVVCLAGPSVVVFLDCMHICACQSCSNDIRSSKNRCPICREVIRDARRVYAI